MKKIFTSREMWLPGSWYTAKILKVWDFQRTLFYKGKRFLDYFRRWMVFFCSDDTTWYFATHNIFWFLFTPLWNIGHIIFLLILRYTFTLNALQAINLQLRRQVQRQTQISMKTGIQAGATIEKLMLYPLNHHAGTILYVCSKFCGPISRSNRRRRNIASSNFWPFGHSAKRNTAKYEHRFSLCWKVPIYLKK